MRLTWKRVLAGLVVCAAGLLAVWAWRWLSLERHGLPYDLSCPVVYDNDEAVDMYTDEYLLALASMGQIHLTGMITSTPIAPYDEYVTPADYERLLADREQLAARAAASGFRNIPNRLHGPMDHLEKPASGRIEDTRPIGAEGSRWIVTEARKATPQRPLVVVNGAPLTAEADAYLLDPSIADRMVIAWLGGTRTTMCDYNGWADPWAAYIVQQKLRLVQFPLGISPPSVPKAKLLDLPAGPLQDYMFQKHHPRNSDPGEIDGDGPPAISLLRRDFPQTVRHVAFRKWVPCRLYPATGPSADHPVPAFYLTPTGATLVVQASSQDVSTAEWWHAIRSALSH